jgi:hypothetical protein
VILAELGGDHFLLNKDHDTKTVALAITVIRWLESPEHPTSSIPKS